MDHPLRQLRSKLDLTLRGLSAETGVSTTKLWRVENWVQDADLHLLRQVSALAERRQLKLRVEDFLAPPAGSRPEQGGAHGRQT